MPNPGNSGYNGSAYHLQSWIVAVHTDGNPVSGAFSATFPLNGIALGGFNLTTGFMKPLKIDDTGALVVAASVSASIAAFLPTGHATLAVSNVTGNVAFASADNSLVLRNSGSTDCFFKLGAAGVTAATTDFLLKAGDVFCLDRTGQVRVAAITAAGASTLEIWTGTGLATMAQAGGSGGGGGNVNLNQVGGVAYALGQGTMAASMSVAIASNQSAIPVTGTFWQATQPVSLTALPAFTAIPTFKVDQTTNGVTNAVDILNLPVTVDTNRGIAGSSTVRMVRASSTTPTVTPIASAAADTLLLAANTARTVATIANDSTSVLYVLLGTGAASSTNYTAKLFTDDYYEIPGDYTGQIRGRWVTANGFAYVTELT